ncbi:hypothetical protein [Vreelandella salicampi]|uniref:Uncharacterized protein n=1 Tax=Vreelandella salicampi TaxID=1449798 RepID=A0A7Z0RUM2_9GAMM|nr:hypothetical protein [Halomonas salicampi]NYS60816.1 hypothetical protein [Halomonas salicampi]
MDDELKAIQDDLDAVLERLGRHLQQSKYAFFIFTPRKRSYERQPDAPFAPAPWILDGPYTSPREDAARVVFQYVCGRQRKSIKPYANIMRAIYDVCSIRNERERRTIKLVEEHGEDLGHLIAAITNMTDCYSHGLHPPETLHTELLGHAAEAYLRKEVEYLGQDFGLKLNSKREVDRKAQKRFSAVLTVFNKHRQDSKRYPIGEALFELAGAPYGMSASVVKRAYYAPGMQEELARLNKQMDELEKSHPPPWSKTDEN